MPEDDVIGATKLVVSTLARRKAHAAAAHFADVDAVIVGCDSMLDLDGVAQGKPADAEEVRARWHVMRSRSGILMTGHCLVHPPTGRTVEAVVATTVRFGSPSDAELEHYIATGEPMEVAGAFTLEGFAAPFIDGVDGDPSNVIGLSLPALRSLLATLGVEMVDLWN